MNTVRQGEAVVVTLPVMNKGVLDRPGISRRIREARDRAGLTREELSEILKCHIRSVDGWENPRQHTLPFDRMADIAEITGVSVGWLMQGDEGPEQVLLATLERVAESLENLVARVEALELAVNASLQKPSGRAKRATE